MADNVVASAAVGTGATFATDDDGTAHHPYVKVEFGADNTQTPVSSSNPLPVVQTGTHTVTGAGGTFPVTDSGGSLTVDGTVAISGTVAVTDNSGSLTVDNAALSVTGGGVEASSLRVTLASDSTGVLSVDDNGSTLSVDDGGGNISIDDGGNSITVDGSVTANAGTNLNTSALALDATLAKLTISQGTALGTNTGALMMGSVTTVGPSYTNGNINQLSLTTAGALRVDCSGTSVAATVTNAGTFAVQVDGSALTALQLIDDTVFADDAAFTPATSKVNATGFLADETATDSVDEGDIGIGRMTLDRKQHVAAELESSAIRAAGTALTPKFAVIAHSASGANTLVVSVSGKKLRVLAYNFVAISPVNAKFQSNSVDLTGLKYCAANGGLVAPFSPLGWFETGAGSALGVNLSAGNAVGGELQYIEV